MSYAYDSLKRLTGATAITGGSTTWTQAFGYDGFGNMTSKSLNGGANMAPAVDPTTNRLTSGYDANGNMLTGYGLTMTYDERNRVASASPTSGGTEYYGYAPDNKRIYRWNPTTGVEEWTFYGARGERIGAFELNTSGTYYFSATQTNLWFAGQLISNANGYVFRDRVGSNRATGAEYYPYGDEITSTANGTEKYGTYFRDSFTTLDYADQRYYASSYGRFNTADPYKASAGPSDPGSWNRYAYVEGDPVNNRDPRGLFSLAENYGDSDGDDEDDGDEGDGGPAFYYGLPVSCQYDSLAGIYFGFCNSGVISLAGTANGDVTAKNFSQSGGKFNAVTAVLNKIQSQILGANNPCSQWLNSGGSSASAAIALLENLNLYGVAAVNSNSTSAFVGSNNADGTPSGVPAGTQITVNTNGAFFNSTLSQVGGGATYAGGSLQAQTFILIHELAHLLEIPNFLPDAGNSQAAVQAEANNNAAVQKNCGQQIQGIN